MHPDTELALWERQWQAQDVVAADLRRRVDREIGRQRRDRFWSWVVTLAFGIGIPVWAIVSRRVDVGVLAAAVWTFIAVAWTVSWRLRRGLSPPDAATTTAFLGFAILSCRRRLAAIAAVSVLYAVMLAFNLAWVHQAQPAPLETFAFLTSPRVVVAGVVTVALGGVALWDRRRTRRELDGLLRLRQQLEWSSGADAPTANA